MSDARPISERVLVPGSPAWWQARPRPTDGPRRGRPPRSFERIVAAASELVDEGGAGSFSMRLLAERLQTSTATLYRHISGKDELMVFVVDRLFGEMLLAADAQADAEPATWQEATRRGAEWFRRTLAAHPHMLPLLVTQVPIGPNGLAARERMIATLAAFGFTPYLAARAYTTVAHYVIGFAIQQQAPDVAGPREAADLADYYRTLDSSRYPRTIAAADALTGTLPEDEFLEGLEFILAGIAADRSTGKPTATGARESDH